MNTLTKIGVFVIGFFIFGIVMAFLFRVTAVTFVDNYELAFSYDRLTGKIEKLNRTGYFVRTPLRYNIHGLDLRPYQVSIAANSRILNAKLVKFNPDGLQTFVEWHGRNAGDDVNNLQEILKCYAFDRDEGRDCPFLKVIQVLAPNQGK